MTTKVQYDKLVEELNKYVDQYYSGNESEIEDPEFDSMYREIEEIETEHPDWVRIDSPTQRVMGNAENTFNKVEHAVAMLSLSKSMNAEELAKWVKEMVSDNVTDYSSELKLDGLACKLVYSKGRLKQAATRGDGKVGEDITQTVLLIPAIPKVIDNEDEYFEVRGEIFLPKSGLEKINLAIQLAGSNARPYKNVRNAASGILRSKTPDAGQAYYLKFGAYMLVEAAEKGFEEHIDAMKHLTHLGFETTYDLARAANIQLPWNFSFSNIPNVDIDHLLDIESRALETINNQRPNLDFDIDGIVYKANKFADQKRLGLKTSVPNWATAYKFPAMTAVTILEGVDWLLGSKGNITPLARVKTVNLCGVDISNVTLHNLDEIERLEAKIGDHVTISRQGDVIPKIKNVLKNLRTGNETEIVVPTVCPKCGKPVTITGKGAFIRCDNDDCVGRLVGRIENIVNKLEIKDLGIGIIEKIVEAGLVQDAADIFGLTENQIANLNRTGAKTAKKIVGNIQKSISSPLSKVIAGLTLPGVGDNSGKNLGKKYGTLDKFAQAKYDEIIDMVDMGPTTTQNIIDWLKNPINKAVIDKLVSFGVGMTPEAGPTGDKLQGKTFAFTGSLSIGRKEFVKLIEDNGGIESSIKKDLDYLILGDGGKEEKANKARKHGAQVIDEAQFREMLK